MNFKKKPKVQDTKCLQKEELEELVHSIKTFKYLDKHLYSCKVCDYLSDNMGQMQNHVYNFHVLPKRRMSELDIVINYIE